MHIAVLTLFPEAIHGWLRHGVLGRAIARQLLQVRCYNPRDYTRDRHRRVDDRPYGGGPGMVLKAEPLGAALRAARGELPAPAATRTVCFSPQGAVLNQAVLARWARLEGLVLVAGRYEGIDERFMDSEVDEECSVGDYVLSGGELPALLVIESLARLIPGVLGNALSAQEDSFSDALLDAPQYTRPAVFGDRPVPAVLLSGDHAAIERWRLRQALERTHRRRPDLLRPEQREMFGKQRKGAADERA